MNVDIFTLVVQIINLMVLIWVLKHFLYRPLLDAVDKRQHQIARNIQEALDAAARAKDEERVWQQKVTDIDNQKQSLIKQASEAAEDLKETLLVVAKENVKKSEKRWQEELVQQKQSFDMALQHLIVEQFRIFASQSLSEMADTNLQTLIIGKFLQKIKKIPAEDKKSFSVAAKEKNEVRVFTDTKLSKKDEQLLIQEIRKAFKLSDKVTIIFKEDINLICGIEIEAGEMEISWNIKQYLDSFEQQLDGALLGIIPNDKE